MTFINDRLEQTLFTPDDFGSYFDALSRTGLKFTPGGSATIVPATGVWLSDPALTRQPRFVGWRDERFSKQVREWIERCSYPTVINRLEVYRALITRDDLPVDEHEATGRWHMISSRSDVAVRDGRVRLNQRPERKGR